MASREIVRIRKPKIRLTHPNPNIGMNYLNMIGRIVLPNAEPLAARPIARGLLVVNVLEIIDTAGK